MKAQKRTVYIACDTDQPATADLENVAVFYDRSEADEFVAKMNREILRDSRSLSLRERKQLVLGRVVPVRLSRALETVT